jgi:hypothetical protein
MEAMRIARSFTCKAAARSAFLFAHIAVRPPPVSAMIPNLTAKPSRQGRPNGQHVGFAWPKPRTTVEMVRVKTWPIVCHKLTSPAFAAGTYGYQAQVGQVQCKY